MSPGIHQNHLSYCKRLEKRSADDIRLMVIHCTELPDLMMARAWGEKKVHKASQTGNSGHYYIDRDGKVEQWVPLDRVAHHVRGFNTDSIGVELVNTGRYPDWFRSDQQSMSEPYPARQIKALTMLLNHLEQTLPGLEHIAGHEDLDIEKVPSDDRPDILVNRKVDPGPLFPWSSVLESVSLKQVTALNL